MARAGDILYLARKTRGFTQKELARLSGVGQPKISAYERGEVEPRFDVLEKLVGHCGLRLAVRLEDNSFPPLPGLLGLHRFKVLQWALATRGRGHGLLDVRAVLPGRPDDITVLVRTTPGRLGLNRSAAEELAEYLWKAMGHVEVIDLDTVAEPARSELLEGSVPVAFVGRKRPVRETRFEPPSPDERWYATRLLDALPGRLYGQPAYPRKGAPPLESFRYRRAVEAEEKAALDEERERVSDEQLWRSLDERVVTRMLDR